MTSPKPATITFKADADLARALSRVPNRSAFIRAAVLAALDATCPLCAGTGLLTAGQREHWARFSRDHHLDECEECHEVHLVCDHEQPAAGHG